MAGLTPDVSSPVRTAFGAIALAFVLLVGLASPYNFILFPGLVGGAMVALLIRFAQRHHVALGGAFDGLGTVESPSAINFARIQVSGAGGLGLVVIAGAIALAIPRVGQAIGFGLIGGTAAALVVIVWRRGHGGLSSARRPRWP